MGAGSPAVLIHRVTPSRLLPELVGARGLVATEDGAQRLLVDRMRLVVHAGGALERAAELLPGGNVQSVALPSRLGGGYLFHVNAGGGTEIWRAAGWLDKLRPLTRRNEVVADIIAGFDRLYLRLPTGNRVLALDPRTGAPMGLGPLPVSSSYGMFGFADGWRAVVDTDLRGPLATFDAGATWRAVGLTEPTLGVGVVDGNPAVLVAGGRYLIDPRGGVTFRTEVREHRDEPEPHQGDDPGDEGRKARWGPSPLGKRPLRAAVEDGWPDTPTTAVVARAGALARVSLRDGAVLALVDDAYPERHSTCHAVRLGLHGVGFLCGEREGPTTLYEYVPFASVSMGAERSAAPSSAPKPPAATPPNPRAEPAPAPEALPPLAMRLVLRFEKPRFAAASGNGAIVFRGRCADDAAPSDEGDARWYCVRSPIGEMREIRVKGFDLGIERVVGLGDGRIAVIVPPRGGSAGALSIISGAAATSVPLELPVEPVSTTHELRRGMWLDGFEERRPGVLGGWVEAGGPFAGVEITLDGHVKAGDLRDDAGGAIYGGRFAVALGDGGRSFETSDGGMTWAPFDLPDREDEARAAPSRACGPVGCALPGWVRVGWGEPEAPDDMKMAEAPTSPYAPIKVSPTLTFDCSVSSVATAPAPPKPGPPVVRPRPGVRGGVVRGGGVRGNQHDTPWSSFRNLDAPVLAADEYGVDNGTPSNEAVLLRAYAWGKGGADWSRNGRWLVRFDDRFDPAGGVRSSALTASLWSHQAEALEAIGTHASYGSTTWSALLDPSGTSLLAASCRGGSSCAMYSIGDGQPVLPLRGSSAGLNRPYSDGAVRVGETWFFLAAAYESLALWRADLGVVRQVGTFHRASQRYALDRPRLVRRALGAGIGLLIGGAPEPGERSGSWYVLPVDPETGAIGEAVTLARKDLAGTSFPRCAPEQDGWLLDLSPSPDATTNVEIDNARALIEAVEMRVRLDPGRACAESLAARSGFFYGMEKSAATKGPPLPLTTPPVSMGAPLGAAPSSAPKPPAKKAGTEEGNLPLAVTEKATGRRWGLSCKMRKR